MPFENIAEYLGDRIYADLAVEYRDRWNSWIICD